MLYRYIIAREGDCHHEFEIKANYLELEYYDAHCVACNYAD